MRFLVSPAAVCCLGVCLAGLNVPMLHAAARVVVNAGEHERKDAVVSFALPAGLKSPLVARSDKGVEAEVQVDHAGRGFFIVSELESGAQRTYTLREGKASPSAGAVTARREGARLVISAGDRRVLEYQMDASEVPSPDIAEVFRHGAHLNRVTTPAGRVVTGDYPKDHRWHRGIWLAWTDTEFEGRALDFWNMGKDRKLTGKVEFASLDESWNGPVHGGFRSRHRLLDMTGAAPKPVLNESWEVTVYAPGGKPRFIFDLVSTQSCASATPLKLPKYYYGGLGFRGHADWDPVDNFHVLTSDGETNREKANEARVPWIHLGGRTGGELCGIAILCHPDNFRAPQPVRVNPKNPQTCHAPSAVGDWEITPGKPLVSRFRFVVSDGPPDKAELDRLWNDFAHPPTVKVEAN